MDHKAGNGGCFLIGKVPAQRTIKITDRQRTIDQNRTIRLQSDALHVEIVFIGNIADNLFENVLKRHQPLHITIFINDDGNMRLATEECVELILKCRGIGHKPWLACHLHNVDTLKIIFDVIKRTQQILGVDDADNIIDLIAPDWHPRVRACQNFAHHLLCWSIGIDGAH